MHSLWKSKKSNSLSSLVYIISKWMQNRKVIMNKEVRTATDHKVVFLTECNVGHFKLWFNTPTDTNSLWSERTASKVISS